MIYTVTTVPFNFPHKDCMTVGFFETFSEAKDAVEENDCDIAEEGWYRYVVVEEYASGIYMVPHFERWFEWNEEYGSYEPRLERPRKFRNVCCWGMS